MTDLLKVLSDKDKDTLTSYIDTYGILKDYFKGVDAWLVDWNKSKQKLYHLLGNNLIAKKEIRIEKDIAVIRREKRDFLRYDPFLDTFFTRTRNGFINYIAELDENGQLPCFITDRDFENFMLHITETNTILDGECATGFKYKWGDRKLLQIQAGTKPIRAIGKILEYFKEFYDEEINNMFKDFCNKLSLITNDKFFKGNLCLSIHPMDYITMSDNAENWTSCMNWTNEGGAGGCYHVGTVEMMNSNCVIVAYFESGSKTFAWKNELSHEWNSKKWRVLLYATKDILVSGKSYPYYNEKLTYAALNFLHELAEKNLGWKYQYGIERYLDMIHITNSERMENNKNWIRYGNVKKHNIIFDSRGMYNDMLNAAHYDYWCYRNKVKHNIVINYSGKSTCLCCDNQVAEFVCDDDDYNNRYEETGQVVCSECRDKYSCVRCHLLFNQTCLNNKSLFEYNGEFYCDDCAKEAFAVCPDCGSLFKIAEEYDITKGFNIFAYDERVFGMSYEQFIKEKLNSKNIIEWLNSKNISFPNYNEDNPCPKWQNLSTHPEYAFKPLYMCYYCQKEFLKQHSYQAFEEIDSDRSYYSFVIKAAKIRILDEPITIENPKMFARYRYYNLNN